MDFEITLITSSWKEIFVFVSVFVWVTTNTHSSLHWCWLLAIKVIILFLNSFGPQVEMVYSLLSMLGTHDKDDMSRTLLAMSSSQDSCISMRQSGCLPLLIQLLHGNDKDSVLLGNSRGSKEARARASAALHNIIHSQPDDKRGRREIRVLHLLEQIRAYCETCWEWQEAHEQGMDQDKNPSMFNMVHVTKQM